jgi:hypothetical protein
MLGGGEIFSHFSLSITQKELDILISIKKVVFELPLDKTSDLVLEKIGRDLKKSHKHSALNRIVGVYIRGIPPFSLSFS